MLFKVAFVRLSWSDRGKKAMTWCSASSFAECGCDRRWVRHCAAHHAHRLNREGPGASGNNKRGIYEEEEAKGPTRASGRMPRRDVAVVSILLLLLLLVRN